MKKLVLVLAAALFSVSALQAAVTGNINLVGSSKRMEASDWGPLANQSGPGIQFDIKDESWPASIAVGLLTSSINLDNGGVEFEGKTREFDFGFKFAWDKSAPIKPYLAGGVCNIRAELQATPGNPKEDDTAAGTWLEAGVTATLGGHLNLGLLYHLSNAGLNFQDSGLVANGGGDTLGFLIGFHF